MTIRECILAIQARLCYSITGYVVAVNNAKRVKQLWQ